jgi:putative endonuclease
MEAIISEKAHKAIRTYLERKGFDILEEGWAHGSESFDFIAREDDDLVFIDTAIRPEGGEMPEERPDRNKFERLAVAYLASSGLEGDLAVRYDIVALLVINSNRALLRHHRNALSVSE